MNINDLHTINDNRTKNGRARVVKIAVRFFPIHNITTAYKTNIDTSNQQ